MSPKEPAAAPVFRESWEPPEVQVPRGQPRATLQADLPKDSGLGPVL